CSATNKVFIYEEPVTDPDIHVDIHVPDKVWQGTTILADNHRRGRPRIIEVDMRGRIVWEYVLPLNLRQYNNPGFDVELLPSNNVLFVLPGKGIYEINRNGEVVWSHLDKKVSHDADRIPNGNTLITGTTALIEITPDKEIVWRLKLKNVHFRSREQAPALGFYKSQRTGEK
ncbi:MAG: hypothetical protein JRJ85_14750, partial [Deltaproteobacteria bacterium]|nr:hypothetical protein [Deltaproteobacteria bacterium]